MKDCFAFVSSIYEWCGLALDGDSENESSGEEERHIADLIFNSERKKEELLYGMLNNATVQKAYFESGLNAEYAADLVAYYDASWEQLQKCDNVMLRAFPGFEESLGCYLPTNNKKQLQWRFARFLRCYEFYTQYFELEMDETDEDIVDERFFEFMELVSSGMSMEEAFYEITLEDGMWDDY